MTEMYKQKPSELLGIDDTYTAYCIDEACSFIIIKLKNEEKPIFTTKAKSFSDIYKKYR